MDEEPSIPPETQVLQVIENAYYRKVPIRAASLMHLRLAIRDHADAFRRLNTIQAGIKACLFIPHCEHILHKRPSGCPLCGVVHIGGTTDGVQFVRSIDKTSGVPTLVKLEYELETLRTEEVSQIQEVEHLKQNVDRARNDVFMTLLVNFQAWFSARHAQRTSRLLQRRIEMSQYYFRIRRLVRLKREVDGLLTSDIDLNHLYYRYSELTIEVEEYVALKKKNLDILILKMSRLLISKLRTMVLKTRRYKQRKLDLERTLLRATEGNAEKRQREKTLRLMRKKVEQMEKQKWICVRAECNNRKFLSEDRFRTHMNIHKQKDAEKQEIANVAKHVESEAVGLEFETRQHNSQIVEASFQRIQEAHAALVVHKESWELEELKCGDTNFAIMSHASALPHIRMIAPSTSYLYHMELLSRSELVNIKQGNHIVIDQPMMRIGANSSCEIYAQILKSILLEGRVECDRVSTGSAVVRSFMSSSQSSNSLLKLPPVPNKSLFHENPSDIGTNSIHESSTTLSGIDDITLPSLPSSSEVLTAAAAAMPLPNISRIHCLLYADLTSGPNTTHGQPRLTVVDNNTSSGTYVISSKARGMALRVPTKASCGYELHPGDLLCIGVNLTNSMAAKPSSRLPPPVLSAIEASSAAIVFRIRCAEMERTHS